MERFIQAAKDNVDRHLGDACCADDGEDVIRDETYVLAFDGAVDAGATHEQAREIARAIIAG